MARQAAIAVHGGEDGLADYLDGSPRANMVYEKLMAGPSGLAYDLCDNPNDTMDDIRRFMAATSFPFYDRATHRLYDSGYSCRGCEIKPDDSQSLRWLIWQDETYTEEGFLTHFDLCPPAQRLWKLHKRMKELHRKEKKLHKRENELRWRKNELCRRKNKLRREKMSLLNTYL